jgi:hypothetical protein
MCTTRLRITSGSVRRSARSAQGRRCGWGTPSLAAPPTQGVRCSTRAPARRGGSDFASVLTNRRGQQRLLNRPPTRQSGPRPIFLDRPGCGGLIDCLHWIAFGALTGLLSKCKVLTFTAYRMETMVGSTRPKGDGIGSLSDAPTIPKDDRDPLEVFDGRRGALPEQNPAA